MSVSPSSPASRFTLVALGISIASFASLQSLLVPVLPIMQTDLRTDTAGITWALTIWLITAAVATPLLGRVGDIAGKRRTFLLALASIALGSVIAAVAPNLGVLLAGRVLQGLGGAIFPLAFGLIRDTFPAARVAGAIGALSAIMAVGSGLGTVMAGPLATVLTWRGLFLIPLAGVVVGAILVIVGVPDNGARAEGRINIPAAILLSGWLVALLLPLSTGTTWGWTSPVVIGLFALAVVLFTAWLLVELRSATPLVDMRMMRLPGVWNTNLAAVLVGAAMFGVWAYFARFLQEPTSTGYGFGATVGESGLVMLPMLVLMAVVGFFVGPITRVLTARVQVVIGTLLIAGATASMGLFHDTIAEMAVAAAIFGLGMGAAYAAMTNLIVQSVPPTQTGIASGMNANLRTIGSSIGVALSTAIVTGSAGGVSGEPTEAGYTTAFVVLGVLALGATVVTFVARPRRLRAVAPAPIAESPLFDAEAA
jgi:MFS family permease